MKRPTAFGILEIIAGILFIILGIMGFANPAGTLASFVIIYGIGAIIIGLVEIVFFFKVNKRTGFAPALSLISGILGVVLGIMLLFNVQIGAWVMITLFPIWFIVACVTNLANSYHARLSGKGYYWFYIIINILGIVAGALMLFNPLSSAATMTTLLAFFLLLIGLTALVRGISWLTAKND